MDISISGESWQVLIAFFVYLAGSIGLGIFAHRYLRSGNFMEGYFLGHRGLGPWMLALTVAATAISGGTFMGFPSFVYSHGWIVALWICSYMVVPMTTMAILGKRINEAARVSGAVTVPDIFRDRYNSPTLGVLASLLILGFVAFNLVAQFKAGGLLLQEAMNLPPVTADRVEAKVENQQVTLTFYEGEVEKGQQRTPLPGNKAIYRKTELRPDERKAIVTYELDKKEATKEVKYPPQKVPIPWLSKPVELGYLIGLCVFAITVVGYTTFGGYWAVTLTDVLAGVVMLVGVILLAILALNAVPEIDGKRGLPAATERLRQETPPDGKQGELVYGPGSNEFLSLGLAFSFFLQWAFIGTGQPSGMVRMMSFKDSGSLRRALLMVCSYYFVVYVLLVIIFICARAIFPTEYLKEYGSEGQPDRIMPAMIRTTTQQLPTVGPVVAGFLLAAPYAAIISTVAAFLLMISSSLVRDLYQRTLSINASPNTLRRASYAVTATVGIIVLLAALNPPSYLQYIIVFTTSGQGCAFLFPMALSLYWRRTTRQGVIAGMLGGFVTVLGLYSLGWMGWGSRRTDAFAPYDLGGIDPLVWGLVVSMLLTVGVSLITRADDELVNKYFPKDLSAG